MKKITWLLAAAALPMAIALTACGDDDPTEIYLNTNSAAVNYGATTTLTATEKNCSWSSDNDFVASVDQNGKVTANHVGEAVITAAKNGVSATCKVTVLGTNTNFLLPVLDWGATVAQVKAQVPATLNLVIDLADQLGYTTDGGFPSYGYTFSSNALDGVGMIVTAEQDETGDLYEFLGQHYELINEGDLVDTFANAKNANDATMNVDYGLNDAGNVEVYFYPVNQAANRGADKANTIFRIKEVLNKLK